LVTFTVIVVELLIPLLASTPIILTVFIEPTGAVLSAVMVIVLVAYPLAGMYTVPGLKEKLSFPALHAGPLSHRALSAT